METPLKGALEKPYSAVLSPITPPDFRAQRWLTEGTHSWDQDVPWWDRDPKPAPSHASSP